MKVQEVQAAETMIQCPHHFLSEQYTKDPEEQIQFTFASFSTRSLQTSWDISVFLTILAARGSAKSGHPESTCWAIQSHRIYSKVVFQPYQVCVSASHVFLSEVCVLMTWFSVLVPA